MTFTQNTAEKFNQKSALTKHIRSVHAEVSSENDFSGASTSDDSINDYRHNGSQGPLTQAATTSSIPQPRVDSPNWPQFAANQNQANYKVDIVKLYYKKARYNSKNTHYIIVSNVSDSSSVVILCLSLIHI